MQGVTSTYSYKQLYSSCLYSNNAEQEDNALSRQKALHDKLRNIAKDGQNSILENMQKYGDDIRSGRQKGAETTNQLKTVKYSFKRISAQIIRSKTSRAARQAASQAKREVMRLKREKVNSGENSEEIDAAISHAKAIERVARKKVKHLEEEEMARASKKMCSDYLEEENSQDNTSINEKEKENEPTQKEVTAEELFEESEFFDEELNAELSDDMADDLAEFSDEMEEISEEMQEILENLDLEELNDSLKAVKGDMDPEDLKMMKIKHRNKEMKEIVKADSDYLKTIAPSFNTKASEPTIDVAI